MPALTIHTSELLNPCPRQAKLRIEGKEHREAPTALVRGLVAHAALEVVTHGNTANIGDIVDGAWAATMTKLRDEGRNPTAAVAENADAICDEVARVVDRYMMEMPRGSVVGVEIPVSMDIDIDGEPIRFESHVDCVYEGADPLTGEHAVVLIDWKWHASVPTSAYLSRNLQLGLYQYALSEGGLLVDGWPYIAPEGVPVRGYWCHLPNFKPYSRKTTVVEDGEPVEYAKGDARPMNRVLYAATLNEPDRLIEALTERVRMMRADLWPMNPDPTGCHLCQSNYACPAWAAFA